MPRHRKPEDLSERLYEGIIQGKVVQDPDTGIYWHALHNRCIAPLIVSAHDLTHKVRVKRIVECRKCPECMRANMFRWARRGVAEAQKAEANGLRTWFGTLTLTTEAQEVMLDRAKARSDDPNGEFWEDRWCEVRFAAVRRELYLEVRRMFARMRKAGHRFSYMLVFERHTGAKAKGSGSHVGLPHMHFLLHEKDASILKREIARQWPHGFTKIKLCGGKAKDAPDVEKAAFYVAKYLQKSTQARQIASEEYGKFPPLAN